MCLCNMFLKTLILKDKTPHKNLTKVSGVSVLSFLPLQQEQESLSSSQSFCHPRWLILWVALKKSAVLSFSFPLVWPQLKKVAWSPCFSHWLKWAGSNRTLKFHQLPYSGSAPSHRVEACCWPRSWKCNIPQVELFGNVSHKIIVWKCQLIKLDFSWEDVLIKL